MLVFTLGNEEITKHEFNKLKHNPIATLEALAIVEKEEQEQERQRRSPFYRKQVNETTTRRIRRR
jgi:hypothetical protein